MRIEYNFGLDTVAIPSFSVESIEGPHKLFTLATLILNVIACKPRVDVIFHSPNQADLPKKVAQFQEILASGPAAPRFELLLPLDQHQDHEGVLITNPRAD